MTDDEQIAEEYRKFLRGEAGPPTTPLVNKYGVRLDEAGKAKRTADGILFASMKERKRYQELKLLEAAGAVRYLELQVHYPLVVNDIKVATYVADFRYIDAATGRRIVEDSKGYRKTPGYKLKKKLMKACHGIDILET